MAELGERKSLWKMWIRQRRVPSEEIADNEVPVEDEPDDELEDDPEPIVFRRSDLESSLRVPVS